MDCSILNLSISTITFTERLKRIIKDFKINTWSAYKYIDKTCNLVHVHVNSTILHLDKKHLSQNSCTY